MLLSDLDFQWAEDTTIELEEIEMCDCGDEDCDQDGESTPYPDCNAWTDLWKVPHHTTDPLVVASNFYLLQAMTMKVGASQEQGFKDVPEDKIQAAAKYLGIPVAEATLRIVKGYEREEADKTDVDKYSDTASNRLDLLVDNYLDTFYNYVDMVIGGELRHWGGNGGVLPHNRSSAWGVWKDVRNACGTDALDAATGTFLEMGGSFGGPKWANGSRLLAAYERGQLGPTERSNRRMLMDRIFTLVHNNGCMLNKLSWENQRWDTSYGGWGIEEMKRVLDAHSATTPKWELLREMSSADTKALFDSYREACGNQELYY